MVETNAVFERNAIRPLIAGSLPEEILRLTMPHVENHERVLKAALTTDRELVAEAFANDPLVKGRASEADIRKLAEDMLAAAL